MNKDLKVKLRLLFFISLIYIFFYKYLLININELFYGASILGEIIYNFSLALAVSYIFYLFVSEIPKKRDTESIYIFVNRKKERIGETFERLVLLMVQDFNRMLITKPSNGEDAKRLSIAKELLQGKVLNPTDLTLEDFRMVLGTIVPNAPSPSLFINTKTHNFVPFTWAQFLSNNAVTIENLISDITLLPHVHTEHLKVLLEIKNLDYISMVRNESFISTIQDFEFLHKPMYEFHTQIGELKKKWSP